MYRSRSVGVVIPALDEAASVGAVVAALAALRDEHESVIDHIVVCDNGSTDDTGALARAAGASTVVEPVKGYGAACLAGIARLPAVDQVVFVDADGSVVSEELFGLLQALNDGADLVIGSRTLGTIEPGAMSPQQRWGSALAAWLLRLLWRAPVTDLGPFRAIDAQCLASLQMSDPAFGWTVEMQIKALRRGFTVVEVPVTTRCRVGRSKISGTVAGTIGASIGILSTIARHGWRELTASRRKSRG